MKTKTKNIEFVLKDKKKIEVYRNGVLVETKSIKEIENDERWKMLLINAQIAGVYRIKEK